MNMFTDGYTRSLLAAAVCLMLSLARAQLLKCKLRPK